MRIYTLNESSMVARVEKGAKFIPLDIQIDSDDFVLVRETFFRYDYHYSRSGNSVVRRCEEVDSVSVAEIKVLLGLTETYQEIADLGTTFKAFPSLTVEKFDKALFEALLCAKRHGKIDEKEAMLLFDILSGKKSKKQILDEQVCSYTEMNSANDRFVNELPWCYGYNRPYIEHRVSEFSVGDFEFIWNPKEFIREHNIPEDVLKKLFEKLLISEHFMEETEKKLFLKLFVKFFKNTLYEKEEKVQLKKICRKIICTFTDDVREMYVTIAKKLIDENKIHINDIAEYSKRNGYSRRKIMNVMRELGVKPDHHKRRHLI